MQSLNQTASGVHVGIIMDGNGRWATQRGLPRQFGHRAGVDAIRKTVEAAPDLGIGTLTLYAFSTENWRRPAEEVNLLMRLLRVYLRAETARLVKSGTRLTVIGRRDRLPSGLASAIARTETATAAGTKLHLRVAIDYSGREAILHAARRVSWLEDLTASGFSRLVAGSTDSANVDFVIRTSGEQRLSDFLLWEAAYAELYFTDQFWPDFDGASLELAMAHFASRQRRFGGLPNETLSQAA